MSMTDREAKDAYDRTLEEPKERPETWIIEIDVIRHYRTVFYGTRQQAEYQGMFDVGAEPDEYENQDIELKHIYKEE
jgi:hypothetical protein